MAVHADGQPVASNDRPVSVGREILTIAEVAYDLSCSIAHIYNAINGRDARRFANSSDFARPPQARSAKSTLEAWKRANEQVCSDAMIDPSLQEPRP